MHVGHVGRAPDHANQADSGWPRQGGRQTRCQKVHLLKFKRFEHLFEGKLFSRFPTRFVRSVTRVFVVFNVEMSPGHARKKSLQMATQPIQRCKRVFQALIGIAIEELCEAANALLAPVR